jgi:hypothetical protein
MRHTRHSPISRLLPRWDVWLPPLLLLPLGGLLVLEPQGPRSPAGHPIVQLVLALLMYGVVVLWLWCIRSALAHEAYKRARAQERAHTGRPQRPEPAISTHEPGDDAWLPWQNNGHATDRQRRR